MLLFAEKVKQGFVGEIFFGNIKKNPLQLERIAEGEI